ncbi:hypothetical protein PTT_17144 [Pyrenophora teres f. teres 0-1]|uniref:Uncharacterized protein n=1 Tax=Pyrenophora teres f. teres (strain 0-1) TaxID=861557 RepID=E3S3R3_PYRTT|nr:hypothetical protein PTT_17144 [Pyrenophora teres f. teres 0-1]
MDLFWNGFGLTDKDKQKELGSNAEQVLPKTTAINFFVTHIITALENKPKAVPKQKPNQERKREATEDINQKEHKRMRAESSFRRDRLAKEAEKYTGINPGFAFKNVLYLSLRDKQHQPIMTQSALDTALTHMLGQTRIQVTTAPIWRIMHIKTKQDTSASPEQDENSIGIHNATIEVPPPVMLVPKRLASNSDRVQSQDAHGITSQPDQPEQSREQLASKSDQVQSQDATNNDSRDSDNSEDGEDGDNSHESEHDRDYRERGDSDNDEGNHQHIPSTNKRRGRKKSSSGKARRDCSRESTRAKSSPLPLPVPLPTTQLLGDLPEAELDDVQDTAEGLADDMENGEDIEGLLVKIATAKLNNTEAGVRAMLAPPEFWRSAAHKFGISAVNRLLQQANSPERYIPMPAEFSFAPKLGLMAHQAVGIDRFQELVFGPSGGAVLADLMGLVDRLVIKQTRLNSLFDLLDYKQIKQTKRCL